MAYLRQIHGKSIKSDEISEIDGVGGCVGSQVWVIVPNLPFFMGSSLRCLLRYVTQLDLYLHIVQLRVATIFMRTLRDAY